MPNSNGACALIAVSDTIELKLDLPFAACCAESSIPRHRNEQIETQFRRVGIATLFEFKVVSAKDAQKKRRQKTKYHDSWEETLGEETMWAGTVRKTGKPGLWTANKPIDRPPTSKRRKAAVALILASMAASATLEPASAAGPGTDEIRIGNTIDYTGPVRAAGVVGKVISAYFDKVNAEGGVNGRRIKFISY